MKNLLKKLFLLVFAGLLATSATACNKKTKEETKEPSVPVVTPSEEPTSGPEVEVKAPFTEENYAHGAKSYVASSYDERAKMVLWDYIPSSDSRNACVQAMRENLEHAFDRLYSDVD